MNEEDIKNFNTALSLYQNDYPHQNLIEMLKNGSIVEKQIAAIKLEYKILKMTQTLLSQTSQAKMGKLEKLFLLRSESS